MEQPPLKFADIETIAQQRQARETRSRRNTLLGGMVLGGGIAILSMVAMLVINFLTATSQPQLSPTQTALAHQQAWLAATQTALAQQQIELAATQTAAAAEVPPAETSPTPIPTPTTEPTAAPTADITATAQAIVAAAQAELITAQTAQATPVDSCLTDKGPGNYNLSIVPESLTLDPPPGPLVSWDAPLTATWRVKNTGLCPWQSARFEIASGVSFLKNRPTLTLAGLVEPNAEAEVVLPVTVDEVAWKTGQQWEWQPMIQTADESWLQRGDKLALVLNEPWVIMPEATPTPPPMPTPAPLTIQLKAPNPQAIETFREPIDLFLKFHWQSDRALAPGENFVVVITNPTTNEKIYLAAGTSFGYTDTAKIHEFMAKIIAPPVLRSPGKSGPSRERRMMMSPHRLILPRPPEVLFG